MGYTQYFDIPTIDERLVSDTERIVEQAGRDGITLAGTDGIGEPIVSETGISLNGSRSLMQHHEPFVLPTATHASHFCKTERLPYDAVVTAILVLAIVNGNAEYVSSDGTYADWQDGIALYEHAVRKLAKGEHQRVRRLLNHEFRPFVTKRLSADGFAAAFADDGDALNGTYTVTDLRDGDSIAARGSADSIVYDVMGCAGVGRHCHSERLADTIRDIVSRKRESYYRKGGDATVKRSWFDEYVGAHGFNYIDTLCF